MKRRTINVTPTTPNERASWARASTGPFLPTPISVLKEIVPVEDIHLLQGCDVGVPRPYVERVEYEMRHAGFPHFKEKDPSKPGLMQL